MPKFQFTQIDTNYIKKAVMALKKSKSPGPDKIPTKLLKDAIETICQPLAIVFNASLEKGTFPDIWKVARITPVFKSGQKSNLSNYRPISVLSVLLEKLTFLEQMNYYQKINFPFGNYTARYLRCSISQKLGTKILTNVN